MSPVFLVLLIIIALFLLFWVIAFISSLFVKPDKIYPHNSKYYRFLHDGIIFFLTLGARIRVHATGMEKLPQGRFLLVCNHRSNYDPIVTAFLLRKQQLAFISKQANFKIPVVKGIIPRCCYLPIDREDPRSSVATINQAADYIRRDEVSIGVYPEGTRSKNSKLLPFHDCVFKIAQRANVPIVVCAIQGTEKISGNYPLRHTDVYFEILSVLLPESIRKEKTVVLGEVIRKIIAEKTGDAIEEENNEISCSV